MTVYAGYGKTVKDLVMDTFFGGLLGDRTKELEELFDRFPTAAARAYLDQQMQVAETGNWHLSMASSIPCIIGWSRRAQYLYVKYNMHTKNSKLVYISSITKLC